MSSSYNIQDLAIGFFVGIMISVLLTVILLWIYKKCQERRLENRRRADRTNYVRVHNVNGVVPLLDYGTRDNV